MQIWDLKESHELENAQKLDRLRKWKHIFYFLFTLPQIILFANLKPQRIPRPQRGLRIIRHHRRCGRWGRGLGDANKKMGLGRVPNMIRDSSVRDSFGVKQRDRFLVSRMTQRFSSRRGRVRWNCVVVGVVVARREVEVPVHNQSQTSQKVFSLKTSFNNHFFTDMFHPISVLRTSVLLLLMSDLNVNVLLQMK